MADEFDFSNLKPLSVDVKLPDGKNYVLVEASEDVFREFRSIQSRGSQFEQKSNTVTVNGSVGDADSALLKGCLFEVKTDGTRGAVSLGFVRALPRAITVKLAKTVLGWLIAAEGEEAPKDSPTPTEETST